MVVTVTIAVTITVSIAVAVAVVPVPFAVAISFAIPRRLLPPATRGGAPVFGRFTFTLSQAFL